MATIKKLEDLQVWIEAMKLAKIIYKLCNELPPEEKYNTCRHLRENARGCPANIAEGFYRYFKKERLHLFDVAKGNLGEIKSDVYLSYDVGYKKLEEIKKITDQIELVEKLLNGLIGVVSRTN